MSKIIFGIIGLTYRCNTKCTMCHTWKYPGIKDKEIDISVLSKLPNIPVLNITGGEPFLRDDLEDIISFLEQKSKRIVISTNGFFTEKIIKLAQKFPDIGIRISIEGLPKTNDQLRGIKDGFDKGLRTLIELKSLGLKDIGFGITISDTNILDLLPLYKLAKLMKVEFATAIIHNSYYFHKYNNKLNNKDSAIYDLKN